MKRYSSLWILTLMIFTSTAWAYGGGSSSSSKACTKPKFTEWVPTENAEVAPGAAFSFTASANTYPDSIKVLVKGQPVAIKVTPRESGSFEVSGELPKSLTATYARIAISADGQSNCKGADGWLVKIAE
ncbi:MAG: hypothetical protein Q8N35_17550 [Methylococcaceae bacterium]|nr:hypothetical protein [Methylococcaceae bacterium]MDZ4155209.1 hypothetical protein [Methylococcales bacterium]MDP2393519.1 hypothetical protein [Methylococcaceae bacterium]MDP3021390.1 hypothetical protein [Methylococcaceae bacterium]MDP3391020.1 hypothetical protein [Methylococcaceae bacterium]